jgi:ADP-ribose pyrophosphatase
MAKSGKAAKPVKLEKVKVLKKKPVKPAKKSKRAKPAPSGEEKLLSSVVVYQGPLFRVVHDKLIEPGGKKSERDIIRHNGSVVILAIDTTRSKKDPWIVVEWKPLVEYYASPGFLGESMKVFIAEGLVAGDAHPEDDEDIEFRLVKLSDVVKMIDKGSIRDGKTLTSVLLYARQLEKKRKK